MKRYTYIFIAFLILSQLSLSKTGSDRIRSGAVATLSPPWRFLSAGKNFVTSWPSGKISQQAKEEIEALRLENYLLKAELETVKAHSGVGDNSVVGKVIFREPASWSSSFWINVGETTNERLRKTVVAKNSPVVMGNTAIGLIEYVGKHRSRVRLITDASVTPSVQAVRNSPLKEENCHLARGELRGANGPIWRSRETLLRGEGFNDEGGQPTVKIGDVLVTTGMDGVFPAGLRVALVSHVYPLKEGAVSYELEAKPIAGSFNTVSFVTVLPALE